MSSDRHDAYDDAILQVVQREQGLGALPIVTNLDFGHTDPMWTLPIGVNVTVDPVARQIVFPERPTCD